MMWICGVAQRLYCILLPFFKCIPDIRDRAVARNWFDLTLNLSLLFSGKPTFPENHLIRELKQ